MDIRIAIADDHPMIISGIQNMLAGYEGFRIVASYGSSSDLLKGLESSQPDLLLLDIHLSDKTADLVVPVMVKKYPALKILVLTNLNSVLYLHNMFRLGVHGYILKTADPETLVQAIKTVWEGKTYTDETMREKLEQFSSRVKKEGSLKPSLTLREQEILKLTVEGLTIQEIADKLFIGLRTVEYYRSNIFLKLEVKNMAGLIKKALELGLAE
ncbi:MAG: response regulator transcription factor [Alphaproteobacteria bacterium]|nr:MAG: response regulator transcription factor [Alphaproteobacteria bacterium]